jgi:hypothetical protein
MSDLNDDILKDVDLSGLPDPPAEELTEASILSVLPAIWAAVGYRPPTAEEIAAMEAKVAKAKRDYVHGVAAELRLTKKERKRLFKEESHSAVLFAAALMLRDRIAEMEAGR